MEVELAYKRSEGSFINARGYKMFTQTYTPLEDPRGVVLYIHGLADYSARYHDFMAFLAEQRFVVHAYDLQSHGKSGGPTHYIHHFDHVLEDTEQFCLSVKQIAPRLPHVAIGYSLGGLAIAQISLKHPNLFDGMILIAPSSKRPPWVSELLVWTLSWVAPWLAWLRPKPLDISTMCRDKNVMDDYVKDPVIWHCKLPLLFSYTILESGTELVENSENFKVPYLMMQGTEDLIVSLEGNTEFHRRSGSADKTFVVMRDLYHELLHEPEWRDVNAIILEWLDARVSKNSSAGFVAKQVDETKYLKSDGHGKLIQLSKQK